jgi:hypothetical protein
MNPNLADMKTEFTNKHLPWIFRILISGLFLLSAVAKLFPIWAFEKQLVDLGMVDWCLAPYLSRLIIAMETAIAIGILQGHYLRSLVIPVTLLILVAFCVHLGIQMYQHGAMNGNCGCFGQLIPMTPLEAFIKNIVTIGMLWFVRSRVKDLPSGQNRIINLLFIYALSALLVFMLFPFAPCKKEVPVTNVVAAPATTDTLRKSDTLSSQVPVVVPAVVPVNPDTGNTQKPVVRKDTAVSAKIPVEPTGPPRVRSRFADFNEFGGKKIEVDQGKKIICLFVPGCDHCRDAAKAIAALGRKHKMPPVYILFMNEEVFKLPEFFKETQSDFPYKVMDDFTQFFKLLGTGANTPGVFYLWNGNIVKSYEGVGSNAFNAAELLSIIQSNKY